MFGISHVDWLRVVYPLFSCGLADAGSQIVGDTLDDPGTQDGGSLLNSWGRGLWLYHSIGHGPLSKTSTNIVYLDNTQMELSFSFEIRDLCNGNGSEEYVGGHLFSSASRWALSSEYRVIAVLA